MLMSRVLSNSQASTSSRPGSFTSAAAAGQQPRGSSGTGSPRNNKLQSRPSLLPQPPVSDPTLVTARLGAESALKAVCARFGAALFDQLPCVWQHMASALQVAAGGDGAPGGDPQGLIHAMQVCWVYACTCVCVRCEYVAGSRGGGFLLLLFERHCYFVAEEVWYTNMDTGTRLNV